MKLNKPMNRELQKKRRDELNYKQFPSEVWFLKKLKENKIEGYRRNVCLGGRFFGDFVWRQKKVVVEIDGSSHDGKESYDQMRDNFLKSIGYEVLRLRFGDNEKLKKIIEFLIYKIGVNFHRPQHVKNINKKFVDKATNQIRKNREIFKSYLSKKNKLKRAYEYAKSLDRESGNLYLEQVLKKLNLSPSQAKEMLT